MIQQKFDTLSQTWPPQQVITHNLGINPAAALDWVSSLEGFPLSPQPKNDIGLLCLVSITNHILRHKVTFSSSYELACFSSSTLLALVNSATRLSRSLDFSTNCWICFSLASISSCFFWVSCLEAFAWFCNFSSRLVRSFVFDLKKGHDKNKRTVTAKIELKVLYIDNNKRPSVGCPLINFVEFTLYIRCS